MSEEQPGRGPDCSTDGGAKPVDPQRTTNLCGWGLLLDPRCADDHEDSETKPQKHGPRPVVAEM